jgi:transcriptional regulator with XRE-family HTH domain
MDSRELQDILSRNIRLYRRIRDISQLDLAEKADVSVNFICNVENGERWMSAPTLARLAAALGVEPFELLKPPEPLPPETSRLLNRSFDEAVTEVTKTLNQIRDCYLLEEQPVTDPRKLKRSEGGKGGRPKKKGN